jgi:NCS2 family nucleobase:cation symporter-2
VARKPPGLLFGVDERPPLADLLTLALQHVFVISVGWIFVVVIVKAIGGTDHEAAAMIRMSMLASGVGTILQSLARGPVGSGYLCPFSCGPAYVTASILAGREGGLPLIFGLTMTAGVFEALFSRVMRWLRPLFPPEVTGLVVMMVGVELVGLGSPRFLGVHGDGTPAEPRGFALAAVTLAAMVGPTVWGRGRLKLYPVLLGLGTGYLAAFSFGFLTWPQVRDAMAVPPLSLPPRAAIGWAFSVGALIPFVIASLSSTLKSIGDLTLCQRINDADWKRTDMRSVSAGVLAGGFTSISAGLLGGMGQSTFSSNVGLSIATGATSRAIAWPCGVLLILLAFVPPLAGIFAVMPQPVMGAVLVYVACYMILGGIQVLTSRMLDARRTFVVGIAMFFGLSVEMVPGLYAGVPAALRPIVGTSLSLATILAVALNLVMRIGITRRTTLVLATDRPESNRIFDFMEKNGGTWGARPEVIRRATAALDELHAAIGESGLGSGPLTVDVRFDEFNLDVAVRYEGVPIELPTARPSGDDLLEGVGYATLAGFLVTRHADRVRSGAKGSMAIVQLHFDH